MARIRTIKPDYWTSNQVMDCSPLTRLLFIGIWNFCDDKGRMTVTPKKLKALIFPSDVMALGDIRRMIDELSDTNLVTLYTIEDVEYLQVNGWYHQKIDRPNISRLPDPDGTLDDPSTKAREQSLPEGKGREGKVVSKNHQREES